MLKVKLSSMRKCPLHCCILKGVIPDERYPLRLHGGEDQYVGEVQVYVNGTWGAFCAGRFYFTSAKVLCRTLGFKTVETVYSINDTETPLFVDGLYCSRYSSNYDFFNCSWYWHTEAYHYCPDGNATAGVVCSDGEHL